MTNVPTVHLPNASTATLPSPKPKPTSLTGQSESLLTVWDAGSASLGIWECEPGIFTATRDGYDETCVIMSGRATLTSEDGTSVTVGPGDVVVTPRGWNGTWEVHETCRKVYNLVR